MLIKTRELILWSSSLGAAVVRFVDQYFFSDWDFFISLTILIAIDTAAGAYIQLKENNFSSRGFSRLFEKLAIYGALLIISHVLVNLKTAGETNSMFLWVDDTLFSTMVAREVFSIFEKIRKIRPGIVPKVIANKFKDI